MNKVTNECRAVLDHFERVQIVGADPWKRNDELRASFSVRTARRSLNDLRSLLDKTKNAIDAWEAAGGKQRESDAP